MTITELKKSNLKELTKLWNKEAGRMYPMREELFRQNSFEDANVYFPGSLVAWNDEGRPIGFIISKIWQEKMNVPMNAESGWIQALLVDSDYRNQGIGSGLLARAEAALKRKGVTKISLCGDPWHYFPGLPKEFERQCTWFKKRGYAEVVTTFDLMAEYPGNEENQLPACEGVEFALLQECEKESLISFLHRVFPGRWEYEALKYFEKGGTGREFAVLKKNGIIIGFCRINDGHSPFIAQNVYWAPLFDEPLGGIGPLGVDPKERGKGYGLAIVEAGVYFLRNRGIKRIVIDWTTFVDFYGRLGFEVWKEYKALSKEV